MSDRTSRAIWLETDGDLTIRNIEVDDRYKPQGSQTLVQVAFSAINPADIRHFYMGLSDFVAGYEWIGKALETGPSSPFKVGQQLFGMSMAGNRRPIAQGVHQDYILADAEWTHAVPSGVDPMGVLSFSVGTKTSIDALFNQLGFGLPAAGVSGTDPTNEAILIWGGGSIVGQAAVQLASAAGFSRVLATASSRNHGLLKQLGATDCFDYSNWNVVEQVRSALGGQKLHFVFDAVSHGHGSTEGLSKEEEATVHEKFKFSSPALARACCDQGEELKLATVLPVAKDPDWIFVMPYRIPDGVATPKPEGLEALFEGQPREWGTRMQTIVDWILADVEHRWKSPKLRSVKGAEAGIPAMREVFAGKAGGQKVIIEHPM